MGFGRMLWSYFFPFIPYTLIPYLCRRWQDARLSGTGWDPGSQGGRVSTLPGLRTAMQGCRLPSWWARGLWLWERVFYEAHLLLMCEKYLQHTREQSSEHELMFRFLVDSIFVKVLPLTWICNMRRQEMLKNTKSLCLIANYASEFVCVWERERLHARLCVY